MLPLLPDLLSYRNDHVLRRYSIDYPNNSFSAEVAFSELMKFIWLTLKQEDDKKHDPHNTSLNFTIGIHSEMKEIDDMWHTFLLFTRDYMHFCKKYIGKYFHHSPTGENERLSADDFINDFEKFVAYVYDHLGEQCCITWFKNLYESE